MYHWRRSSGRLEKTTGFTLIEVIMAALVLVLLFSVVFRIFRSSTTVVKAGMWVNTAQTEVRNALTLLRDEISRSSPYSKVTASGVSVDPTYKFSFKKGEISSAFSGPIFKFYQCRTAMGVGPATDEGGIVYCEVRKQGSKLYMKKEKIKGTSEESTWGDRLILDDITKINIEEKTAPGNEQMVQATINITITVADPQKKERVVTEETKAKVDNVLANL